MQSIFAQIWPSIAFLSYWIYRDLWILLIFLKIAKNDDYNQ